MAAAARTATAPSSGDSSSSSGGICSTAAAAAAPPPPPLIDIAASSGGGRLAAPSSTGSDQHRFCVICLEGEPPTVVEMPCQCRGTVGLVHEHCLRKLVQHTPICGTCRGHLLPRWRRWWWYTPPAQYGRAGHRNRCCWSCCGCCFFFCDPWLVAYVCVFSVGVCAAFLFVGLYVKQY